MSDMVKISAKTPEVKKETKIAPTQKTDFSRSTNSLVDHILILQKTIGNQAIQRLIKSGTIQAKLRIGQPGDIYEQEADRVAEQVMRMPDIQPQSVQRKCQKCEEELQRAQEEQIIQKRGSLQTSELTPDLEANINTLRSGGEPLPGSVRAFFEPRFGHDFSEVRIHTGTFAAESARAVNARAYTVGQDVVFGVGQYAPATAEGKKLLAHELTHVVQQTSVKVQRTGTRVQGNFTVNAAALNFHISGNVRPLIQRQPTVSNGSIGCPVPELQDTLNATGEALTVDGNFGSHTEAAVKRFQTSHPPLVANGTVEALTWAALHTAAPGNHGLPSGENTSSNGWGAGNYATVHKWRQRLTPTVTSFDHCRVREADPGGGADTCHFPGSTYAPFTGITGGTWDVNATNHWGDDFVGWFAPAVTYYRAQGRAPCSCTFPQSMRVVRPSGDVEYKRHQLTSTIGLTTVSSTRDGHTATKTWP